MTASAWTSRLEEVGVSVSTDGKGRYLDNIFMGRLCRRVKYEYAYPMRPETVPELEVGLRGYFAFYSERRIHPSLGHRTPAEVYGRRIEEPKRVKKLVVSFWTYKLF